MFFLLKFAMPWLQIKSKQMKERGFLEIDQLHIKLGI
jgi:hypothetical protein